MGGDDDDESRQTISAAQLLSMGSCSAEEIGHIRLVVAWGNAFPAGTNGLSAMLERERKKRKMKLVPEAQALVRQHPLSSGHGRRGQPRDE